MDTIIPDGCVKDRFSDPATLESPYAFLAELREQAPVFFSPTLHMYVVSRFADVQYVLNNPAIFSSEAVSDGGQTSNYNLAERYAPLYEDAGVPFQKATLVITDGASHKRYRSAVDRTFTVGAVKAMEAAITQTVDALIDRFIDRGEADIYKEFCLQLPLILICKILGLPATDTSIQLMQKSADAIVRLQGGAIETEESRIALHKTQVEFYRFIFDHVNQVKANPDGSLISQLIATMPDDGVPLDDAELLSIINVLNVGGNETTTNGLGNMFWACFREPGWQERLRADRDLVPKFVEETLRLETPVASMIRWVKQDAEIAGVQIPQNAMVLMSFLGANRDPRQYGCPAHVDLDRKGIRNHLAFGGGVHFCLGANLARLELKIAMNRVLDRMGDIRIADTGRPLEHEMKFIVRALKSLPVSFTKIS
jgi:cytochrome P450